MAERGRATSRARGSGPAAPAPGPRRPEEAAAETFDLAVVGGGAYGIMLALEAVRRGLRPVLVERSDFAAATSHNSLRILHGGLRYLQSLDLRRHRESVRERQWFLETFPDLVEPLPCLMPLYGDGLRRRSAMRAALWLNEAFSPARVETTPGPRRLPRGSVVDAETVRRRAPVVEAEGLRGGALWYDAFSPDAPRLLHEALRWARHLGAAAFSYVEAEGLLAQGPRAGGVRARDFRTSRPVELRARAVVNAAGPGSARFAASCGLDPGALFRPSIAWNVVFRRPPVADCALAVRPRRPGGQTYFLLPWKGALLAGTGHAPWEESGGNPRPSAGALRSFVEDLNEAVPGLDLREDELARVFAGLLPAAAHGTARLAKRTLLVDHGRRGGPQGFVSVSGVKLTTARSTAEAVLRRLFPAAAARRWSELPRPPAEPAPARDFFWMPGPEDRGWRDEILLASKDASVHHLDDLLLRRSSLGDNPERALRLAPECCRLLGWDGERARREQGRLRRAYGLPAEPGRPGALPAGARGAHAVSTGSREDRAGDGAGEDPAPAGRAAGRMWGLRS